MIINIKIEIFFENIRCFNRDILNFFLYLRHMAISNVLIIGNILYSNKNIKRKIFHFNKDILCIYI